MIRDTILVIGPSASGKTASLNIIRDCLSTLDISFDPYPLTDSYTILSRMFQDHKDNRGEGHYHPWCHNTQGHVHIDDTNHPHLPFTVCGDSIANGMYQDFFEGLKVYPFNPGQLLLAEWSGGVNTNPENDLASCSDLSFKRIGQMLSDNQLESTGLDRVIAVIHLNTEDGLRFRLNLQRSIPTEEEISLGTASWQLSDTGMKIFGEDDFDQIEPLLNKMGIPIIQNITNRGDGSLSSNIEQLIPNILEHWQNQVWNRIETEKGNSKERI